MTRTPSRRHLRLKEGLLRLKEGPEIWRWVVEDYYEVSNWGRVRSVDRWVTYRNGTRVFHQGQIIKGQYNKYGYHQLLLCMSGDNTMSKVHQLVLCAFLECCLLPGCGVNHKDGDKLNNFFHNLEPSTQQENVTHFLETHPSNGNRKYLNYKELHCIFYLWSEFYSMNSLSHYFSVDMSTIFRILSGKDRHEPEVIELRLKYTQRREKVRDGYHSIILAHRDKRWSMKRISEFLGIPLQITHDLASNPSKVKVIFQWQLPNTTSVES